MHSLEDVDAIAEDIWEEHKDGIHKYGPKMLTLLISLRAKGCTLPIREAVIERIKLRILLAGETNDGT